MKSDVIYLSIIAIIMVACAYLSYRLFTLQGAYAIIYNQDQQNISYLQSLGTCTLPNGTKVFTQGQEACNAASQTIVQRVPVTLPQIQPIQTTNCYSDFLGGIHCTSY